MEYNIHIAISVKIDSNNFLSAIKIISDSASCKIDLAESQVIYYMEYR